MERSRLKERELLESIDGHLGVIAGLLRDYMGANVPAAVQVAERVLAEANASLEANVAPVPEVKVADSNEELAIGDKVVYIGTRKKELSGVQGTITEIKEGSPWLVVMFEGQGNTVSVRKGEVSKNQATQPPALSAKEEKMVEEHLEEQAEASEGSIIKIDEEAAAHKIDKGSFKEYRNIHAIYSDMKKAEANRKYLRFRASKTIGSDETTKEMCHRYLVSVQDEEYMKGLSA